MIDLQEGSALAPHLSAIIRSPVPTQLDESIVDQSLGRAAGRAKIVAIGGLRTKATLRTLSHSTATEFLRK
jgi:hypothetical protein